MTGYNRKGRKTVCVTFVTSDNSKNDFISGKIQHVDFAVPAWFVVNPVARVRETRLKVSHTETVNLTIS